MLLIQIQYAFILSDISLMEKGGGGFLRIFPLFIISKADITIEFEG